MVHCVEFHLFRTKFLVCINLKYIQISVLTACLGHKGDQNREKKECLKSRRTSLALVFSVTKKQTRKRMGCKFITGTFSEMFVHIVLQVICCFSVNGEGGHTFFLQTAVRGVPITC